MPDRIHLLIQGTKIIYFIRLFKGKLTPSARSIEAERKLRQGSFYDHAIRKEESLHHIACYIWENPVRAKIVDDPANYIWPDRKFGPTGGDSTGRDKPCPNSHM